MSHSKLGQRAHIRVSSQKTSIVKLGGHFPNRKKGQKRTKMSIINIESIFGSFLKNDFEWVVSQIWQISWILRIFLDQRTSLNRTGNELKIGLESYEGCDAHAWLELGQNHMFHTCPVPLLGLAYSNSANARRQVMTQPQMQANA